MEAVPAVAAAADIDLATWCRLQKVGPASRPGASERVVGRREQRARARIDEPEALMHQVHDVAEAQAVLGIGVSVGAARTAVAERIRVGPERLLLRREEETEAEARRERQDAVRPVRLLGAGALDRLRSEQPHAVDLAPERECRVDARERPGVRVSIRRGDLGSPPLALVLEADHGRVREGLGEESLRILEDLGDQVEAGTLLRYMDRALHEISDAFVELRAAADVELNAERIGDRLADHRANAPARDATDHLTDEPAVGERVVTVGGAGLPPGLLLRQRLYHRVPLV